MTEGKVFRRVTAIGICLAVFMWGCAEQAREPVKPTSEVMKPAVEKAEPGATEVALKPKVNEQTRYKIKMLMRRSIEWEGPVPKKEAFETSFNEQRIEMVVDQQIQSVDVNGLTSAEVTIDSMKCVSIVRGEPSVDFDSSRASDANSLLAKLMGQSYKIKFGPDNRIISVYDLPPVSQLIKGQTPADRIGRNILSVNAIKQYHATLTFPGVGEEQLQPGNTWSRIKTFSFGMMGLKSYEKIYTLKDVRDVSGHQIAVVDMNAIPSSEIEPEFRDQQAGADFPRMFDSRETYTGSGEVDLTSGRIDSYEEHLIASWITALPAQRVAEQDVEDANEPVVLKMAAQRSYGIKRIR